MTLFDFLPDEAADPEPPDRPPPPDQDQRDIVAHALDTTLFVEAGAGSGKSTALVGRVLELVTSGAAELRSIAAITFTEKAAAELRDRIRQQLEQTAEAARAAGDGARATRCDAAIDQLDGAAIGTLHSFAQRILAENPIEVELPPRLEIVDEVSSDVQFDQRWRTFQDRLLEDPAMERTLLLLFATGVRPAALRALAVEFDRNWDLVEERVDAAAPEPPQLAARLEGALAAVDAVCERVAHCTSPDDKLAARLHDVARHADALRHLTDELDLLDELSGTGALKAPSFKAGNIGAAKNWGCDHREIQADLRAAGEQLDAVRGEVAQACARRLAAELRAFTLDAAAERRASGQLAFHDLLVLARQLVRHHPSVRGRLHRRYQRLLLDEFQDTDPIQIEIAVRIAAAEPESASAGELPWHEVAVRPGHLFVVGDPKQSIYRFRRADISLFLAAKARYGTAGGLVTLSTNFRTGEPIIAWVNHAFGRLLAEGAAVDTPVPSQPDYVALQAVRPAPEVGPAVSILGRDALTAGRAAELRSAEARQVAATIARIRGEGWTVGDDHRPARLGDITVLVPARTSLPFLEDELDAAAIPYRAESSSLVYVSRAVRDLLMCARAVDDPADPLAVVSALRSPLFACGDDDLFRHKVLQGGTFHHLATQPGTVEDGPVAQGLAYLAELHRLRHWTSPAELLERIARDRRLFELGFAEGRTRDVWRRLRFVIDQAREWGEATDGNLREYLLWVARQSSEGSRVAEAVLPESDDDAVRIMTIHAAKGLEFPITIVSGMSTAPQARPSPAQVVFPSGGGVGYRFGKAVTTDEFEDWKPIDEQMAFDERVRLLYVACTRAKDHLVLSLQRKVRAKAPEPAKRTNAELLLDGCGDGLDDLPDAVAPDVEAPAIDRPAPPSPPPPFDRWRAELDVALARASRPTTVAATALTAEGTPDVAVDEPDTDPEPAEAGVQKRPRDLDLPPWLKGRYGTSVGRAVHGTLQTIDLADPTGLAGAVAAQCEAEAIPDRVDEVEALVHMALATPVVAAATIGPHWREVYAGTPTDGGRLLEGYIDLLYRTEDGMVIVDYKTAATNDPAELAHRVAGYRLQGGAYALAVRQTTGSPIARVCFAFLTPAGPVEIDLDDVDAAIAEVEALVAAGAEVELG
ncbi:MAG: UvrD-helicase domain-containing protein [Acidimicrobiales bacterium]|nr:UvrD-helicase domain-containing protein [Acidimicrobiales bacterium]